MPVPELTDRELWLALSLWSRRYSAADIAEVLHVTEAAVANSIGRFHGFTQGRAA